MKANSLMLNRRSFLQSSLVVGGLAVFGDFSQAAVQSHSDEYLAPTPLVDSDHPDIVTLVKRLAPADLPVIERTLRIFTFVRDEVLFGFGPRFYDHRASAIAEMRRG
jgi:transglutaminase-like putative cysteine protease